MRLFYLLLFFTACGGAYPDVDVDLTSPETREQIRARCEQGCEFEIEYCSKHYEPNALSYILVNHPYDSNLSVPLSCVRELDGCLQNCGRIYYFE